MYLTDALGQDLAPRVVSSIQIIVRVVVSFVNLLSKPCGGFRRL